jgi:hypothetical protein
MITLTPGGIVPGVTAEKKIFGGDAAAEAVLKTTKNSSLEQQQKLNRFLIQN